MNAQETNSSHEAYLCKDECTGNQILTSSILVQSKTYPERVGRMHLSTQAMVSRTCLVDMRLAIGFLTPLQL